MRFKFVFSLACSIILSSVSLAEVPLEEQPRTIISHGLSAFGELKYEKGFPHFDYVNPEAPKGGQLTHSGTTGTLTFDSFNPWILKGDKAEGMILNASDGGSLFFDTLMVPAGDEPDAMYGLVAYEVEYPEDRSWIIFRLREEARFHDGSPITAEDVKFSLEIIRDEGDPRLALPLRDMDRVEVLGSHEVKVVFKENVLTRDLPMLVANYPVLSKAYYAVHDFTQSTLEVPLGSGPYKVGEFKQGSFINYIRDPNYWAKDLNVIKGRWNFEVIRFELYKDRAVDLQAFKSHQMNLREEFTSKFWATEYDFPAVNDGRVMKRVLEDGSPSGTQGFFINTRREKFSDIRVRKALDLAFDFEWTNKTLFYDLYDRTVSYFEGSKELAASGLPSPAELELLEPFRGQIPESVFGEPYLPPVTDGSGRLRKHLKQAGELLKQAGWTVSEAGLANEAGELFEIEVMAASPSLERIVNPYIANLKRLGINARFRLIDAAQYERRRKAFDFDMTILRYSQSNTPGVELRNNFGSEYADSEGSFNLSGIQDPVVDALIEKAVAAKSREELVAASRALDRVLRAGHYWVSNWAKGTHHIAIWDEFEWPEKKPLYLRGILDTWWVKPDLKQTIGGSN